MCLAHNYTVNIHQINVTSDASRSFRNLTLLFYCTYGQIQRKIYFILHSRQLNKLTRKEISH
jgi:hypothetical protein